MVNSSGVWRLPFSATYRREKSWRSSADSMAITPSTAPATITHAYLRPASRSLGSRRCSPSPSVATPIAAPKRPSQTPAVPKAALISRHRRRHRHTRRVLGDVVLGVLHHDAVAGEGVALEVAFQHDGNAGLEQLGRIAGMGHRHDHALALDVEAHRVRRFSHRAGHDVALHAEPARAELLLLGDGLVGGAEVEGGVAEPAHDQEPEGRQHDEAGDDQAAPTLGASGRALLGYGHRGSRSSGGSSRASARFLPTIQAAYDASTPNVTP